MRRLEMSDSRMTFRRPVGLIRAALRGSGYAVAYVLLKIALGLGYPLGKLYVILLAFVVGAIGGALLYLLQNFSRRGTMQYYLSWGLTGAVIGTVLDTFTMTKYPPASESNWTNSRLLFIALSVPIGMIVGSYARDVRTELDDEEQS